MCHVHQDFYADPVHFSFWWDVKSTFSTAIPSLDWKIERLDGTPQPALTGTITDVAAFNPGIDGHGYFAQWIEQQPGARHQYRLSINPTHAITETAYQNNEYIFEVDVPDRVVASVAGDLEYELDESHVHVMMPDSEYGFHFVAHNRLAAAIPATRWRLQDEVEGIDQSHDLPAIAADGTEEAEQDAVLTVPGLHIVTITIDSTNLVSETNEDNNVSTFYIIVGSPLGDG